MTRDMGLTRAEFLRSLPAAVSGCSCTVAGERIAIRNDRFTIDILLGEERVRKIGALALPAMSVEFRFDGSADHIAAFMEQFDRAFRRGGG